MDGITKLFQGATSGDGGWLSKALPLFMAGSGSVGNILANRSRNQVLSEEMKQMKYLQGLTPAQISQMTSQLQQPLSQNLINNVGNATQAQMASRGLAQAPGIYASTLAQGLAPYQLQEQQLAQDALFKKLGLPISARPSPFGPFPQSTNTSQLWQSILQRFMGTGGGNQMPTSIPAGTDATAGILQQIMSGGQVGGDTGDFSSTQLGGG